MPTLQQRNHSKPTRSAQLRGS